MKADLYPTETARGQRHVVKTSRWEIVSSPTQGYMKGTWLPVPDAKKMLRQGDFYENGTCIKIHPVGTVIYVKDGKVYRDKEFTQEYKI
jgi:hypothetical protein